MDEPLEWETKTITSAAKAFFRNLPEPLMTFKMHNSFNAAASKSSTISSVNCKRILVRSSLALGIQIFGCTVRPWAAWPYLQPITHNLRNKSLILSLEKAKKCLYLKPGGLFWVGLGIFEVELWDLDF